MLSRLDEEMDAGNNGQHNRSSRGSLKDRFKALRMREEAGIPSTLGEDENSNDLTPSATAAGEDENTGGELSPVPAPNSSMAPGTVSGVNAGPSAMPESEVDWDLWQSVVYEGPAAVARTSAEELNRAIATGIPSAIRGVIWQVLAQSKSHELEGICKDLLVRGTDLEKVRHSNSTTSSASQSNLNANGGDAVNSSASSTHSNLSGAFNDKSSDLNAKNTVINAEEKKRKGKEDAAALQKLEKVIRRDLGARTSYSKYAAAQGLQESLFGVCKAYALYDEGVGYAQGMNFLIMPLLFNVRTSHTLHVNLWPLTLP
jgi:hypothetical protein